jgi:hypothetical protein
MVDHSNQMGPVRCLLIWGIRLSGRHDEADAQEIKTGEVIEIGVE